MTHLPLEPFAPSCPEAPGSQKRRIKNKNITEYQSRNHFLNPEFNGQSGQRISGLYASSSLLPPGGERYWILVHNEMA